MAYDELLAARIRAAIQSRPGLIEKKMFGGLAFMLQGNMSVGVIQDGMIVRIGPDEYEEALRSPHVSIFDFTGRPMKGWVVVSQDGLGSEADMKYWVEKGASYALSLPAK